VLEVGLVNEKPPLRKLSDALRVTVHAGNPVPKVGQARRSHQPHIPRPHDSYLEPLQRISYATTFLVTHAAYRIPAIARWERRGAG
jgi:hypothetical protein